MPLFGFVTVIKYKKFYKSVAAATLLTRCKLNYISGASVIGFISIKHIGFILSRLLPQIDVNCNLQVNAVNCCPTLIFTLLWLY